MKSEIQLLRDRVAELEGATIDLNKCPSCGGIADQGHDRCVPPSPYYCTKCTGADNLWIRLAASQAENARLREALEVYACMSEAMSRPAREALAGESK
jgi:hypothetical protein